MEAPLKTACPECNEQVPIPPDVLEGELIVCDHCGVELELVTLEPIEVQVFEEEEK
jgi:alpha-aminoadipate/glutamate carrier protein LysW